LPFNGKAGGGAFYGRRANACVIGSCPESGGCFHKPMVPKVVMRNAPKEFNGHIDKNKKT
jgi:hypothetical protein